jgi:N-methylhydantoinase A/oxoprolinase/acetone carboxylase beta subunit
VLDIESARRLAVATISSGPTNSMRGAAFLAGLDECAVVDVGGTTADIGIVTRGFPRESGVACDIAGVRTNFRMPDLLSLGIGGGSLVRGSIVGPDSVGHELTERALSFGGHDLTLTDIAVAGGRVDLGDPILTTHLAPAYVRAVLESVAERIAEAVDRMRTSAASIPVVMVGGGSVLIPDVLNGLPDVRRPAHFAVANAVGAAIGQVGGEVDRVFQVADGQRGRVLDEAKQEAVSRAEAAGARSGTVRVVEVDEIPLAYLPGGATRIRVKAVGDLAVTRA